MQPVLRRYKLPIILLILLVFWVGFACADKHYDSFKVAIFKEDGFPYIGVPEDFNADWIMQHLKEEYDVIYLDAEKLKDRLLLNIDKVDLLILPYGEAIPEDGLLAIVEFIKKGGGLFTTAGRPFGSILKKEDKTWNKIDSLVTEKYLSDLGLYYYSIKSEEIESTKEESDIFVMNFDMKLPVSNQYGLCIKTSERIYNKPPTRGNVFPFRIPVRSFLTPIALIDRDGNYIGSPLTLVKSWSNPYKITDHVPNKWCLIGFIGEDHPLNPKDKNSAKRLKEILKFLSTRIILTGIETDYASYKSGESIKITTKVLNYGNKNKEIEIVFFVIENNNILLKENRRISINGQEGREISLTWKPEELQSDFYEVKTVLKVEEEIIDEEKNAFTVWHKARFEKGEMLEVKGKYFYKNDSPFFLYGINYYESKIGELMWVHPNILDIEKDIRSMSSSGINFLRVHYHHPKWFRDYFEIIELPLPDYFSDIADAPLPDEKSLRILDAFIILCNKYNIYFHPDLFTLVPEEMGDPRGWIGDLERCRDPKKIEMQKGFVRILSDRYKDVPNIIWDLWNEPFLEKKNAGFLKNWVKEISNSFRSNGDQHLITLGSDESIELADELDFICGHGYAVEIPEATKPFIMQEVWNESDLSPEREEAQAEELRRDLVTCFRQGGAGFVPWQWTRQARLWDEESETEKWDNELGLCVREDGSLKPAGKLYRDLIKGMP